MPTYQEYFQQKVTGQNNSVGNSSIGSKVGWFFIGLAVGTIFAPPILAGFASGREYLKRRIEEGLKR